MKKYAFVTGGLGFIGSNIARMLIDSNIIDEVICLDHFGQYVNAVNTDVVDFRKFRFTGIEDRVTIERADTKYYGVMYKLLNKYRPEYIFHLAALPLAKLDNLNPEEAREGSVQSTSNILEIINTLKENDGYCPSRFVYTSSSMVYGDFVMDTATEEHPTLPKEIYGTMKLAGEVITKGLGNFYEIPWSIVRPSAVYGPTDMNNRVSQIFVEKAFNGDMIKVQGKDEALDFTFVKDTARGFILAAIKDEAIGETFNITYGKAHTLFQFVTCLQKHFPDLKYTITQRDDFRPKRGTLSIEKAKNLLGYTPEYDLQRGINEYVEFNKKYHPLYSKKNNF